MIYKFSSLSILLYRKGNLSSRLKVISSKGLSPVILLGVNSQRNEIAMMRRNKRDKCAIYLVL